MKSLIAALWMKVAATVCAAALVSAASGCEEKAKLAFEIVTPEGDDPFEGVTEVVIRAGEEEKRKSVSDPRDISLAVKLELGSQVRLELEGADSEGNVICSATSPYFFAVGSEQNLRLWVSRVGRMSPHPEIMETGAGQPAVASYIQQDWDEVEDDLLFTYWFGGCDGSGLPVDVAGYFDPYIQEMVYLPQLEDSEAWADPLRPAQPRCGSVAMSIEAGLFLVFGGVDSQGRSVDELDLVIPTSSSYEYLPMSLQCDDSVDNDGDGATDTADEDCSGPLDATEDPDNDWARAHARATTLGPYFDLFDDLGSRVLNSYLVTGGRGATGERSKVALHILAKLTGAGYGYSVEVEELELLAARAAHTATVSVREEDGVELRTVLVYGGTSDSTDVPVAETVSFQLDSEEPTVGWSWNQQGYTADATGQPLPRLTGHAAVSLADGKILVAGGRNTQGELTADGWLFDPSQSTFTHLPGFLGEPRAGHTMTRTQTTVLVAGGEDGAGELADRALIIRSDSLSGQLELVGETPMSTPRWGHAAFVLANGQIGVLGGFGRDGEPLDDLEIFNPDPT